MARISHDERTGTIRIAPARPFVNTIFGLAMAIGASTLVVECLFNRTAFGMPADTPVLALVFVGVVLAGFAGWALLVFANVLWELFGSETIAIDRRSVRIRRTIFGKTFHRELAFNAVPSIRIREKPLGKGLINRRVIIDENDKASPWANLTKNDAADLHRALTSMSTRDGDGAHGSLSPHG